VLACEVVMVIINLSLSILIILGYVFVWLLFENISWADNWSVSGKNTFMMLLSYRCKFNCVHLRNLVIVFTLEIW
jgi:hypothetical protein